MWPWASHWNSLRMTSSGSITSPTSPGMTPTTGAIAALQTTTMLDFHQHRNVLESLQPVLMTESMHLQQKWTIGVSPNVSIETPTRKTFNMALFFAETVQSVFPNLTNHRVHRLSLPSSNTRYKTSQRKQFLRFALQPNSELPEEAAITSDAWQTAEIDSRGQPTVWPKH